MLYNKKADYDRNSFFSVLNNVKELTQYNIPENSKEMVFLSFGEREPDIKTLQANSLYTIKIVEGFKPNVDRLQSLYPTLDVTLSTISDFVKSEEFLNNTYEIIWWYHGPEHLEKEESLFLLKQMQKRCKLLLTSMPHGYYEQGAYMNNNLEIHRSSFYIKDFETFGDKAFVFWETPNGDDRTSIDVVIKGSLL